MLTLHLARHGQTDPNAQGRIQGRGVDAPLNAVGRAEAEALAERLAAEPLQAVYTSALVRTHQTAAPLLALRPDLPATALADLDEMDWGAHEGRTPDDAMRAEFADLTARWAAGDADARPPGGESAREVEARARRALAAIRAAHAEGAVLAVTHGRFLRVLLASVLPGDGLARMAAFSHPNCALTTLELDGGTVRLVRTSCTLHLPALAPA